LGEILYEGDQAAQAPRLVSDQVDPFERRLEEARAFGHACNRLADERPELSARTGLTHGQLAAGYSLLGALVAYAVWWPSTLMTVGTLFLAVVFGLIIATRLAATIAATLKRRPPTLPRLSDAGLPPLSLLVPLYKESANVVTALLDALRKLDYPVDKLEAKLLVEADDQPTIDAIQSAQPPSWCEIIPVPPGEPRTKPKALNYGLAFTRGEVIAVFDAEDRPSPAQPREAVAAFMAGGGRLAVVQAPLLIHNARDSWLARQFEIEYAIYFRVWLPFLARLGLPLALGGTSNYFRRERLEAAGGWDAWNVTEDADLGLRLARFGGRAAVVDEPTWEEAPARYKDWIAQRTRWMKGHLQTWLVVMRNPADTASGMGWRSFGAVQLTLGGSLLTAAMHLPLIVWVLLALVSPQISLEGWHAALFGIGYGSVIAAAIAAQRKAAPVHALILLPLYWPLLSIAMIRALWEMKTRPHFWAKTPHGVRRR
jgi:cellulose synthase/poly-beta-1,6-N-acetylglucosamine synthase-like glycosyltransferase